jgi:Histidine kinase-like ATPase domain
VVRMQRLQQVSAALAEAITLDEVARVVLTAAAGRAARRSARPAVASRRPRPVGCSQLVADDAVLCLSEVVTNAVIHAGTPTRVVVEMAESRILVTVLDSGRRGTACRRSDARIDDVGGRGWRCSTRWLRRGAASAGPAARPRGSSSTRVGLGLRKRATCGEDEQASQ